MASVKQRLLAADAFALLDKLGSIKVLLPTVAKVPEQLVQPVRELLVISKQSRRITRLRTQGCGIARISSLSLCRPLCHASEPLMELWDEKELLKHSIYVACISAISEPHERLLLVANPVLLRVEDHQLFGSSLFSSRRRGQALDKLMCA
jgi:hypothetical protein